MSGAGVLTTSELMLKTAPPQSFTDELKARYEIDCKWRAAWVAMANKFEKGRLQSRQEAIERKAALANSRIFVLMKRFDAACT